MQNIVVGRIGRRPPPLPELPAASHSPIRGWEGYLHLRCRGRPCFRNSEALDLALMLDLDPQVEEWSCLAPMRVTGGGDGFRFTDFEVTRTDGSAYHLDVDANADVRPAVPDVEYVVATRVGLLGDVPVRNARGVMAHAGTVVPLSDQVRLLARLMEAGPISLSKAAMSMRATSEPVGAMMALAAHRIIRLDWTTSIIGPRTKVEAFPERNSIRRRLD